MVHGTAAEEILAACDEEATFNLSETVGSNAAVHFFRGLRHRNLAAMKLATKSGITHIHGPQGERDQIREKTKAFPLVVNGFRTNPKVNRCSGTVLAFYFQITLKFQTV